ncbi:MAG TPA: phosphoglucosamine mutase [Spirochaetota bacterium]|nr:phosphoglucosamine mutase [Spirochaetota bacterium]
MKSPLMKSVSGIRGIVGESFTPELLASAGSAFAKFTNYGTVVVGRDSRPTGEAVSMNLVSVLLLAGCNVVDIGIVPTPTVQVMVEELNAAGGIVLSASHNPVEWNALKLINSHGTFLTPAEIKKLFKYMDAPVSFRRWDKMGKLTKNNNAGEIHLKRIFKIIDSKKIRESKLHVVLDSVNGAGSIITPDFLRQLNCKVTEINCTPDGLFPRGAEPLPENLKQLSEAVIKNKADIGFAQDPDADRLAIVDENGKPLGEEYTIALVADHILARKKGSVVVNLSTTRAVEDVALKYKVPFFRAKVGEINVVEEMKKREALIGGEGNGGVISPEVHLGRDSLAGIAYILEMMSSKKKKISEIMKDMPEYYMKKGKVTLGAKSDVNGILDKIKNQFKGEKISSIDGLRIDFIKNEKFKNGWVHLRSSNTEPIFRIITEADSVEKNEMIYKYFAGLIK